MTDPGDAYKGYRDPMLSVMKRFGVAASARASFALYNTLEEVAALADALERVREVFAR